IGRGQEKSSQSRNLQVEVKGFGGSRINQFFRKPTMSQHFHNWSFHIAKQRLVKPPANTHSDRYRGQRVEDARPEFLKMLEKTHGAHGLPLGFLWFQFGDFRHGCFGRASLRHGKAPRSRPASPAKRTATTESIPRWA